MLDLKFTGHGEFSSCGVSCLKDGGLLEVVQVSGKIETCSSDVAKLDSGLGRSGFQ